MTNSEQLIARLNDEAQFDHNHKTLALLRDSVKLAQDAQSAFRTLEHIGYTNQGGEYWQPPVGKVPNVTVPNQIQAEFNRAINFAIEQGIDADDFLRAWREGDLSEYPEYQTTQVSQ